MYGNLKNGLPIVTRKNRELFKDLINYWKLMIHTFQANIRAKQLSLYCRRNWFFKSVVFQHSVQYLNKLQQENVISCVGIQRIICDDEIKYGVV